MKHHGIQGTERSSELLHSEGCVRRMASHLAGEAGKSEITVGYIRSFGFIPLVTKHHPGVQRVVLVRILFIKDYGCSILDTED